MPPAPPLLAPLSLAPPTTGGADGAALPFKEAHVTDALSQALVAMREDDVLAAVREANAAGTPPADIIAALQAGMKTIGDKYEAEEYYLSELIMAAEIFKEALAELGLDTSAAAAAGTRGTVVLGTVKTDIHDIGKNIVASVLGANGFTVVDLGVDVPAQAYLDAAREHDARVVGLSCLLTTAFPAMQETIKAFADAGLRDTVKIMIGGGPVTAELCAQLGADGAGTSAQEAVNLAAAAVAGGAA
jgi:methylmalonyl-CoA mutase cobalamin-binding domain/chain